MKQFLTKTISLVVVFVFGVMPCFATGGFAVTNMTVGSFAGWAAAANVKQLVGDFNGDRRTDVALTGNPAWLSVPVAFSNGDGTFFVTNAPVANFPGWAATANVKPLVGDFNADGKSDIALTGSSGWSSLPVAFSRGDGSFFVTNAPMTDFPGWASAPNAKPLVGDFDGDRKTDIALTGVSGWSSLPVASSNGDGSFRITNQPIASFPGWAATANVKPLVGDFNADGKTDIALTGSSAWSSLPVAFSSGGGNFNITNHPIAAFPGWAATVRAKPLVGDFNADSKSDIALTGASGWASLPVAFSIGNGNFNITNHPISNFAGWAAVFNANAVVGDFNGDGRTDVALTGAAGWITVPVAFSNGNGAFQVFNQPIINFAGWASAANAKPLVGDINQDGRADVVLTGASGWSTLPVAFSLSPQ